MHFHPVCDIIGLIARRIAMNKVIDKIKNGKYTGKIILSAVLGIGAGWILFYFFLPPLNLRAIGFWVYLTAVVLAAALPFLGLKLERRTEFRKKQNGRKQKRERLDVRFSIPVLLVVLIPVAVLLLGMLISSPIFNARSYASIIDVEDSDFAEDIPETGEITNIALMDTASATILGNRTLGSLSHVVSQYTVSTSYTQINYRRTPQKVANLEYDGFFKWIGNKDAGVPGMVMVDPVNNTAEYIEFSEPMYYVESAYFEQDLMRKLRFMYPTKIFESVSFEVDDDGHPYYIVSCAEPQVLMFGAYDITEVIIFDPCNGTGEIYPVSEAPAWLDIVYTGYLATDKYNWYGTLSGGFLNSIIGNVGCKQATDDFGYIVLEDDVWYFTGVTSAVSDDKSNIGFIITNARTGEYKFYPVIGAEEHSAMAAAEGEVQEKGYTASFPSLINVADQATYIMTLKDAAGLVKLYALVNVENYSIVATGQSQAEAMSAYKKLLQQNDIDVGDSGAAVEIEVENVRIATVAGASTVYITATDGNVYKGYLETDETLILIRIGDRLTVRYATDKNDRIFIITSWEFRE